MCLALHRVQPALSLAMSRSEIECSAELNKNRIHKKGRIKLFSDTKNQSTFQIEDLKLLDSALTFIM